MNRSWRDAVGYAVGFLLFVCGIPLLMRVVAGPLAAGTLRLIIFIACAIIGLGFSVWSIVYMKRVGRGNPLDAFNHELAPRTQRLMTEGPYRLCRNPMLAGVLLYYAGLQIWLLSWRSLLLFLLFLLIMLFQVRREEQRLERDFGAAYLKYKRATPAFLPGAKRLRRTG